MNRLEIKGIKVPFALCDVLSQRGYMGLNASQVKYSTVRSLNNDRKLLKSHCLNSWICLQNVLCLRRRTKRLVLQRNIVKPD